MKPFVWMLAALFAAALLATIATHLAIYQKTDIFQAQFKILLAVDGALIALLAAAILWMVARQVRAWRSGEPGARLSLRLTLLFWGISLLPAVLLYSVSVSAVFRGIESWFDAPLGRSFERGIAFGQDVIGGEFARLEQVARDIAASPQMQRSALDFYIGDAVALYGIDSIALLGARGEPLAQAGQRRETPLSAAAVQRALRDGLHLNLSGSGIDRAIEVGVPVRRARGAALLLVARALPADIAEGLAEIERGRQEYEQLQILRGALRWSFVLTMSLALLLILLALGWISLRLGRGLTRPLVRLSLAAEAVGQGDFSRQLRADHPLKEIAHLNHSFNLMVGDLRQLHQETAERQAALRKTNAYLENLLSSLTTGVLTFAADGALSGHNAAAERFFQAPLKGLVGQTRLPPSPLAAALEEAVAELRLGGEGGVEKRAALPGGEALLLRALALPATAGGGLLVMVDDISRQIRAEREATWEEASQRFVHEIKNPLTPIQLAAERLGGKLGGKLAPEDDKVLRRLVDMIVSQVAAMREMVDAFRDYANKQSAQLTERVDLHGLLQQVLYFYENRQVRIARHLQEGLPPVSGNAVTLRQLLHNIVGNAMDALDGRADGRIDIRTAADGGWVELRVEDNGGGVPADMLQSLCEPYVTNKPQGTGLGLAVVRKTVDEHGGRLAIENGENGLRVSVRLLKC